MGQEEMELRVASQGRVYGPMPLEKLIQLATQGRLDPQDQVRRVGSPTWQPVRDVPILAASMVPVRPQTVPPPVPRTETSPEEPVEFAGERVTAWKRRSRDQAEDAAVDMAPMIDVTFLLLIFFMLTNSLANPSPMDVPEAVHGRGVTLEGQQLILIDAEGNYFLGNTASEENRAESLDALLAEVQSNADANDVDLDVILNAHKQASYLQVRELIERLGNVKGVGRTLLGVEEQAR